MKLIVGLGNPGREYARNRHNVGFRCLDRFAKDQGFAFTRKQPDYEMAEKQLQVKEEPSQGLTGIFRLVEERVLLLKPRTFMNESGRAVAPVVRFYRIPLGDLLVVHDDLDLPLGRVRIRPGGSSAGHRGIQSIADALGSEEFPRIRVGIGRPEERGQDAVSYVLGDFTAEEEAAVQEVAGRVSEAILVIIQDGLDRAMNRFNPA